MASPTNIKYEAVLWTTCKWSHAGRHFSAPCGPNLRPDPLSQFVDGTFCRLARI